MYLQGESELPVCAHPGALGRERGREGGAQAEPAALESSDNRSTGTNIGKHFSLMFSFKPNLVSNYELLTCSAYIGRTRTFQERTGGGAAIDGTSVQLGVRKLVARLHSGCCSLLLGILVNFCLPQSKVEC